MSRTMNWPMNWQETVKAAALAVQAERPATTARNGVESSYRWDAYDIWLSRAKPLRDCASRPSPSEQATPPRPRQGACPRD
jgi:hypothetical protein